MKYKLKILRKVEKDLLKVPASVAVKIRSEIRNLSNDPRPSSCCKLKGKERSYRIRIGKYRVLYEIFDDVILIEVFNVDHRKDVYR